MPTRRKDIIIGATAGIGLGIVLLAGIALLSRPNYIAATQTVQPALTATAASSSAATVPVPPSVTPEPSPAPAPVADPLVYIVQEGDSLFAVALEYGTTVEAIMAASGLASPDIFPGDRLTIPPSAATSPAPTPFVEGVTIVHQVVSGETLWYIADRYGVTVETIMSANGLSSDAIQAGQRLIVPLIVATASAPLSEPGTEAWQPSILEGDLEVAYPLTVEAGRFTLHYQPDSLPARDRDTIVGMLETALAHIEGTLQVALPGRFDAFAAGSLFPAPNLALRGRSFSSQRLFLFLYDGTGTAADRQYIVTHELTHVTTWNTMGPPASVMLHEGVAVYVAMELVESAGYVPIEAFCAAYHQLNRLPRVSGSLPFRGHIRDLDAYYAAGCFVQYLIEEYGTESFASVYHSGDYHGVYGQGLSDLEAEWLVAVGSSEYPLSFAPDQLVYYVMEVASAYDRLFADFTGSLAEMTAYQELDRARVALLQGRLVDTAGHLNALEGLLAGE